MSSPASDVFARWVFGLSLASLTVGAAFLAGYLVRDYRIFPHQALSTSISIMDSLLTHGEIVPEYRLVRSPRDSSREWFVRHDIEAGMPGFFALLAWDDTAGQATVRLFDHEGTTRHVWPLDYNALGPREPGDGSEQPHGFVMLPDGSFMVNFDHASLLARVDACGKARWVQHGSYHHSLQQADDGSFWTWLGEGSAYAQYQYLVNFDPATGETIRRIGLIEDVIDSSDAAAAVFLVRRDFPFEHMTADPGENRDLFHPNDIDVLRADVAPAFADFEAGDLLISLRKINLVAVLDPDDHAVKWASHGPWLAQHDPDFTRDGKISVYNNNTRRKRSEIIHIDPVTREVSNPLAGGDARFYSSAMGKHQYLPNGNVLIVVPGEGRLLEVTENGRIVTEINNLSRKTADYNGHVDSGVWLPGDYFDTLPACPG